jgi:hypothetical protein
LGKFSGFSGFSGILLNYVTPVMVSVCVKALRIAQNKTLRSNYPFTSARYCPILY